MFKKSDNHLVSLNIGKKSLIIKWLDEMQIEDYFINDDYTIDVNSSVDLRSKNLINFPNYIQFKNIQGVFYCSDNELISLKGCPNYVDGAFTCRNNMLNSLNGCPDIVQGWFDCSSNKTKFTINDVHKLCNCQSVFV